MSFPRYSKYKDSNVDWFKLVPSHWSIESCRSVFLERNERNDPLVSEDYLSLMANVGVMPYEEKGDVGNKKPEDLGKCKQVHEGDLVINSMNYGIGSYGLSKYRGVCSPVYIVLTPKKHKIEERFAFRILETKQFQKYAQSFGNGILEHRAAINWDTLKNIGIPTPPIEEQRLILNFLDYQISRIDALIAEQERLIELLNEKRQAEISNVVTKGLDPKVKMKDSGIEWLGKVPEHWKICLMKRAFRSVDYGISDALNSEGLVAILRMGNIQDGQVVSGNLKYTDSVDPSLLLETGDLLYNRTNSLDLIGKVGMFVSNGDAPVSFASYLVRLRTVKESHPDYFAYLLNTKGILGLARSNAFVAIGQCNLNPTRYGQIVIAVPPLLEQVAIADHLNKELKIIKTLTAEAQRGIELLVERRMALISEAITGQVDVRQLACEMEAT